MVAHQLHETCVLKSKVESCTFYPIENLLPKDVARFIGFNFQIKIIFFFKTNLKWLLLYKGNI